MGVLLNRNCDFLLGFNISSGTPTPLVVNQSLKDSELVQPYSEGTQADDNSPGPAVSLVLPIIYAFICASGVLANGLVMSVVLGCKQKVASDIYILNLATADLLFLLGMPLIIHQLLQERGWVFGDFLCWAATTIDLNNQFSSVRCFVPAMAVSSKATRWGQRGTFDPTGGSRGSGPCSPIGES